MNADTIKWGETYDIELAAADADGDPIALDETWDVACRVTKARIGGPIIAEPAMTTSGGKARCTLDTGDPEWAAGTYYYDLRLTDPDGNDYWTEAVKLTLTNRNAPASTPAEP
jgi:hypothetical protein